MRIVHVTDTFLPKVGGAEIAIDQLVRAMEAGGDSCAVLAQWARHAAAEIKTPYRLMRFANPRSSLWAGWWVGLHLLKLEREFGTPDVVIGHHAFPPGFAAVKYAMERGLPSIVYPRGGDIYEVSRFRRKKHAWGKLTWALTHASAVVCASQAMEELVRQIIGPEAAEGRIVRIPNGVNLAEMQEDATASRFANDVRFEKPFVLGLGRIIRRKGFDLLIEAMRGLPDSDWRLVIAGEGRELPALKVLAEGLGNRVLFTGLVEGADKRWLLQHCAFMAAPSLEESFGNVALEAMACGKPVIASQASGFAEIIKDGVNGALVKVGDVVSLRRAMNQYQSANLDKESQAARMTAQDFSWKSIAQRYHDLIAKLSAGQVTSGNHIPGV